MNAKMPPINRRKLIKKDKIKELKTKGNLYNNHWNYWKFQLHWNKIYWLCPNKLYRNNNPSFSLTQKFYMKDGNELYHLVGNSKLESIGYDAFSERKECSAALTARIGSSKVSKKNKNASTTFSTSSKDTSY